MATQKQLSAAAAALGSRGGRACARRMTPAQRTASARKAAQARWAQQRKRDKEAAK